MSSTRRSTVRVRTPWGVPSREGKETYALVIKCDRNRISGREILPIKQCLIMFSKEVGVRGFFLTNEGTLSTPLKMFHSVFTFIHDDDVTANVLLPTRIEGVKE